MEIERGGQLIPFVAIGLVAVVMTAGMCAYIYNQWQTRQTVDTDSGETS